MNPQTDRLPEPPIDRPEYDEPDECWACHAEPCRCREEDNRRDEDRDGR